MDHFLDALSEVQIRLRLREVGPSTLAKAEKIAVRMEANILFDKQRTKSDSREIFDSQLRGPQPG